MALELAPEPYVHPTQTGVEVHPTNPHRLLLQFNRGSKIDLGVHDVLTLVHMLVGMLNGRVPSEYDMALGVAARRRIEPPAPDLLDALTKLTNEAAGFLAMADVETHGCTNFAVLRERIEAARTVLAQVTGEQKDQDHDFARGGKHAGV